MDVSLISSPPPLDVELNQVRDFLLSKERLDEIIGKALRKSFDEVIDGQRTGRFRIEQLEKTEKTYIGTKVEIVLRSELALARGEVLDNLICGHEVDTKFSLSGGWMIPREAIDHLCLLVRGDDNSGIFSVGLLRMTADVLRSGANQDGKKSVSAFGKRRIVWLINSQKMPPNFLLNLDPAIRDHIMGQRSGMKRIEELFRNVNGKIIPRAIIEQLAQQKDPARRARQMKDRLISDGIEVLCAMYSADRARFKYHGFNEFNNDDWLSIASSRSATVIE